MAEQKTEFLITARDATAAAFSSVQGGLGKIGSMLGSVQAQLLGVVGVAGFGALIKSSMDATDALAKASDRLGITTQALGGLRYAGELAGVSAEKLDTGLTMMSRRLIEAAQGSKESEEAFRTLGLSAKDLTQIPADQAFARISDALNGVENTMQRTQITMDIFGRSGAEMMNLMASGAEGFAAARREAEGLGLAVSRVDAAKIEIANDSITRIKSVFAGLGNTIAVQLSPYIQAVGDWLVRSSIEADGFRGHIATAMEYAVRAVGWLMDAFHGLHVIWKLLQQGWYELQNVIIQGIAKLNSGLADLASLLPGIEVKPNPALQQWAADSRAGIEQTRAALEKLVMEPMPSAGIDDLVAKFRELNQVQAETIATSGQAMAGTAALLDAPGVGDKEREQTVKYEAELQKQIAALMEATAPKLEALSQKYAQEQALLDEGYVSNLISEQLYYEQSEALKVAYETRRTELEEQQNRTRYSNQYAWQKETAKLMQGSYRDQLAGVSMMLGQLSTLMYSSKKKEFELGKKAATGQALINTYLAASNALSIQPFWLGLVMMAIAIATGMANVRRIQSQKFGGGGGASPTYNAGPGGIPSASDVASDLAPQAAPSLPQTQQGATARTVNVTVESDSGMVSMDWLQNKFAPVFAEATADGAVNVNFRNG